MAHLMAHPQTPLYKESQSVSNLSPSLSQSQQLRSHLFLTHPVWSGCRFLYLRTTEVL